MFKYNSDFDDHSQLVKYLNLILIMAITILIYVFVTNCFLQCYCQDVLLHSINHIIIVAYKSIKESSGETYELVSEPAHNLLYSYSDLSSLSQNGNLSQNGKWRFQGSGTIFANHLCIQIPYNPSRLNHGGGSGAMRALMNAY